MLLYNTRGSVSQGTEGTYILQDEEETKWESKRGDRYISDTFTS